MEADPDIYTKLVSNIEKHNLSDIDLINKAVWNEDEFVEFSIEGADGGRVARPSEKSRVVKIKTIALDELIREEVDFLKMDIEGAEVDVICSSNNLGWSQILQFHN